MAPVTEILYSPKKLVYVHIRKLDYLVPLLNNLWLEDRNEI